MKWVNGLTAEEKDRIYTEEYYKRYQREHTWTKWFAWFPVVIGKTDDNMRYIKAWLQYVERKRNIRIPFGGASEVWHYKEIKK